MFTYTDNQELKKELKKAIIDNEYTAKMICDKLNMIPQTYQTLINKKQFSFADMKRICDAMDCDLIIDIVKRDKETEQEKSPKRYVLKKKNNKRPDNEDNS